MPHGTEQCKQYLFFFFFLALFHIWRGGRKKNTKKITKKQIHIPLDLKQFLLFLPFHRKRRVDLSFYLVINNHLKKIKYIHYNINDNVKIQNRK